MDILQGYVTSYVIRENAIFTSAVDWGAGIFELDFERLIRK